MQNDATQPIVFSSNDYEIVDRKLAYQGFFSLAVYHIRHRLFRGGWSNTFSREVLERHAAAAILPYDPKLDRVILIEQFRAGSLAQAQSPWLLEIPAGLITDDSPPDAVARREATEEAGCKILAIEQICEYFVTPGASNEYIHIYCGQVDATHINGIHGLPEEHEDIRVHNLTADAAFALVDRDQIRCAPVIISLLWLKQHRERLRQTWMT